MDKTSKNRLIERIEYILSYLLSRKHDHDIQIYFKKEEKTHGDCNKTRNIGEK